MRCNRDAVRVAAARAARIDLAAAARAEIARRRGAGPGKKDEPTTVKVGDTILYGKYSGTELTVDGTDYLIMRESDIFAIL